MLVIGWDGRKSGRLDVFGSVLDQILARSKQLVVVAKLGHPLNTTGRIILILPPQSDRHPGFFEAARGIKLMANQLNTSLLILSFSHDETDYGELLQGIEPEAPITGEAFAGWERMISQVRRLLRPDDLVIVMSGRRGSVAWTPKLENLPQILAGLSPESFLMIYPSEVDTSPWETAAELLPRALVPGRIVANLPEISFRDAMLRLLRQEFGSQPRRLEEIGSQLVRSEQEFSSEIRPGVVVPHVLVDGLEEPILFLGISTHGIQFPKAVDPAKAIFLILSPVDKPQEHLNLLAEVARLVAQANDVEDLIDRLAPFTSAPIAE